MKRKTVTFNSLHTKRKVFVVRNKNKDHVFVEKENKILISAPHGVTQVRLGKRKVCEIGSLATAIFLAENSKCSFIAKTKNNFDDANFDEKSEYKSTLRKAISSQKIEYLLDFHGLSPKRECDINLGTHLGENTKNNEEALNILIKKLTENNFKVFIDQPFMAGSRTIAGSMAKEFPDLWTIQIEINCAISNNKENFPKYQQLLFVLLDWINNDLDK